MSEPIKRPNEQAPSGGTGTRLTSLTDYLRVLRRRKWLIVGFAVGLAVLAAVVSLRQDATYEATAQVVFRDPLRGLNFLPGGQSFPQESPVTRSAANAELITAPSVSEAVKRNLDTELTPDSLAATISTQVGVQTNIVSITAATGDAQLAADIANAFAEQTRRTGIAADQKDFKIIANQLEERLDEVRARDLDPGLEALQLGNLQNQLAQVRTIQAASESVEIVSVAEEPAAPSSPATARNTVLGGLLGLVLGLMAAFVRDSLDRRIHSAQQVGHELDLPVVGRVSNKAMGVAGLAQSNGSLPMADAEFEAFRTLRMNLAALKSPDGSVPRSVLVTSGLAQEGKSTVSMSLASAAAIAGQSVLLVECDLRRPVFEKRLGIARSPGLSDYLTGAAEPKDILQTVKLASPWTAGGAANGPVPPAGSMIVISAGSQVANPAELLVGQRFHDFIAKVSRAYDLVIVDSSPLLSVVDPLEIAPNVDAVLACVRADQTTVEQLRATGDSLGNIENKPIGVVVTGIKKGGPDSYDYYYGY